MYLFKYKSYEGVPFMPVDINGTYLQQYKYSIFDFLNQGDILFLMKKSKLIDDVKEDFIFYHFGNQKYYKISINLVEEYNKVKENVVQV